MRRFCQLINFINKKNIFLRHRVTAVLLFCCIVKVVLSWIQSNIHFTVLVLRVILYSLLRATITMMCCVFFFIRVTSCNVQGSHSSWKVLEFLLENFQDLGSPEKWPWYWKVLEFARQWCRWQLLASNRHVSADENSHNCCHQVCFLGGRYAKNAFAARTYSAPPGFLSCCFSLYLNIAGFRKGPGRDFRGPGKSWNICNKHQESGIPECISCMSVLPYHWTFDIFRGINFPRLRWPLANFVVKLTTLKVDRVSKAPRNPNLQCSRSWRKRKHCQEKNRILLLIAGQLSLASLRGH